MTLNIIEFWHHSYHQIPAEVLLFHDDVGIILGTNNSNKKINDVTLSKGSK